MNREVGSMSTDRIPALLEPIQHRLNAATPGPWESKTAAYSSEGINYSGSHIPNVCEEYHDGDGFHAPLTEEDGEFIANAPTDQARLLAAVQAVADLHRMEFIEDGEHSRTRCEECLYEQEDNEECPTLQAVVAALGGEA